MEFDSWSIRDRIIMVWALFIASVALVFVLVSIGNVISDNSSNIASWVQAIGVIIALCITILIATWPRKQAVQNSVAQAKAFVIILYKYLGYIKNICPGRHEDSFRLYSSIIRDLMEVNANLNYGLLPVNIVAQCYEFRIAGVLVEEFSKGFEKNNNPVILNNLYEKLEEMSDFLNKSLRIIIDESNSILGVKDSFEEIVKSLDAGLKSAVEQGEAIVAARKSAATGASK